MKQPAHEPLTLSLGRILADAVGRHLESRTVDLVVPVPMHWRRRLARGTNTARLLAESVARSLAAPAAPRVLRCRRKTRKQGTLRPDERRTNMQGAFRVSSGYDITDSAVLLVDDIMTTGATANNATRALCQAGASPVIVAVVARGIGEA
jgi:ComF family protein